jgi:hypothetical protein
MEGSSDRPERLGSRKHAVLLAGVSRSGDRLRLRISVVDRISERYRSTATVNVPPGTFAAMGAEGQYAFVIPAYDLVIVHRINSDVPVGTLPGQRKPEPTTQQLARLLWLLLSAAGDNDVGPDITLAHAAGDHLAGETLKTALSGATLSVGEALKGGPYRWQLGADGSLAVLAGAEHREILKGTWHLDNDRYCRTLRVPTARELCFSVVANKSRLQFYDADGLMRFDTKAE